MVQEEVMAVSQEIKDAIKAALKEGRIPIVPVQIWIGLCNEDTSLVGMTEHENHGSVFYTSSLNSKLVPYLEERRDKLVYIGFETEGEKQ